MPIPAQIVKCYKYIDSQEKNFIEELRELVAIPSVSSNPEARRSVDFAIKWMHMRLLRSGFIVELKDIGSHVPDGETAAKKLPSVILATLGNNRRKKTLLYYCHLDVFKVKLGEWDGDPFTLRETRDKKLQGRGTAKMKGPILCLLHAVDTYQALGMELPINLKIVCESMNECGSPGLAEMLQGLRTSFLTNIDCMLMTNGRWTGPEYPCILYGLRGVCHFELTIEGLTEDLHSGEYGGIVQEPLQDLVHILNHLVDANGTLTIPGLDKDTMQVTPDEEKIYSRLKVDMEEYRKDSGLRKFAYNADRSQTLMRAWRYPSFSLQYVDTTSACECPVKLRIPKKVNAKFSIWIVPCQTPERMCRFLCDHLNAVIKLRNSPNEVRLRMEGSLSPWIEDHRHWNYESAKTASKQVYKDPANLVREGKPHPSLLEFRKVMPKMNILLLPLVSSEANIRKKGENISLRCYIEGTKLLASYFHNLSIS